MEIREHHATRVLPANGANARGDRDGVRAIAHLLERFAAGHATGEHFGIGEQVKGALGGRADRMCAGEFQDFSFTRSNARVNARRVNTRAKWAR